MIKKFLYLYILLFAVGLIAQKKDSIPNFSDSYYLLKDADSIMVHLDEINVLPKNKFASQEDLRYYFWFKRKVYKAYPYAILASERIDTLKVRLSRIKSKSKQKKYTKRAQKYLEGEFTKQLKKMTRTEGRILVKLIHRQTGKTTFENIKELRSGWKAFWYNTTANVFKLSLKTEFDPENVNEDFLIEDVLQRAFRDEKLKERPTKLSFDFSEIIASKRKTIDVEEYKRMFAKMRKKKRKKKKKVAKKATVKTSVKS